MSSGVFVGLGKPCCKQQGYYVRERERERSSSLISMHYYVTQGSPYLDHTLRAIAETSGGLFVAKEGQPCQ